MLLPVNCPYKFRYANVQRDGAVRLDKNGGGSPNYFPNSFGGYRIAGVQSSWNVENSTVGRYKQAEDYFVQPAEYWNVRLNSFLPLILRGIFWPYIPLTFLYSLPPPIFQKKKFFFLKTIPIL